MQKPSTVAYRDFVASLNKLISESELPAFVLIQTFQNITAQLAKIEERQYAADKAEYERQLRAASAADNPERDPPAASKPAAHANTTQRSDTP